MLAQPPTPGPVTFLLVTLRLPRVGGEKLALGSEDLGLSLTYQLAGLGDVAFSF